MYLKTLPSVSPQALKLEHLLSGGCSACILPFTEIAPVTQSLCGNQYSSPFNKVEFVHSLWRSHRFSQSVRVFAFIIVVFMCRHLQPEPTCTWHNQSQPDTNSPLGLPSITTHSITRDTLNTMLTSLT